MSRPSRSDDPQKKSSAPPPNRVESEETAPLDDAVIGRAFRASAIALIVLLLLIAVGIGIARRKKPPGPTTLTPISAPAAAAQPIAQAPTVRFTDITREAGITFSHHNGATGDKLLPETMGGGVAFLDYDSDGDQDLFFVNATSWPGHAPAGSKPSTSALYQNDGKGSFRDVTAGSGLDVSFYGTGVAVGDFDNDGLIDVFCTAVGGNHLFRNGGAGRFREITAQAEVGGDPLGWSTCASWLDLDNDGDLDLFVANYVKWSREIDFEVGFKIDGVTRAYGPPMTFGGSFPYLYRNDGAGKFSNISTSSGVQQKNAATGVPAAKTLGVAPVDLNRDGWIDLIVANDTTPNMVFTNAGNGTFREIGQLSGLAFDSYGNTRGAMGIDAAHYRNDTTLGVVIGNFANEMTALYTSQQDPAQFTDAAITEGIGPASRLLLKFGVFFFDYDLDGRLDVLSANGHLEEEIAKIQKSQHYHQPAQLFWNTGSSSGACFASVSAEQAGSDLFKPIVGRGSAYADIDGDGDLDVVLTQSGSTPLLLRNDQALGHAWLRLHLVGTKSNRSAIGAWVQAKAGSDILQRQVMPTRSYLSQSELPITLGLGKAGKVDHLEIRWPGGAMQKISSPAINTLLTVQEP